MYNFRTELAFNPQRDITFQAVSNHPAAFLTMMAFSSFNMAYLRGGSGALLALKYETAAIRMIGKCIEDSAQRYSDGMATALGGAIVIEHHYGSQEACRIHFAALEQLLRSRGGGESLIHHPPTDVFVTWVKISCGHEQAASLRSFHNAYGGDFQIEIKELNQACDDFTRLFNDLRCGTQAIPREVSAQAVYAQDELELDILRSTLFGPSTPLHILLSSPTERRRASPKYIAVQNSCQLACLLFLNIALFEHQDSPKSGVLFLKNLRVEIARTEFDRNDKSVELLLWVLLRGVEDRPKCKWWVVRLMKIVERLCESTTDLVKTVLLGFLEDGYHHNQPMLSAQDLERVRMEALYGLLIPGYGRAPADYNTLSALIS